MEISTLISLQMPLLPLEMINYIFTYCQSPTNTIMKQHYKMIEEYTHNESDHLKYILITNKRLGFKHFNARRYRNAYYHTCDYCNCYLTFDNYTKYFFENLRFCSERCEYLFDVKYVNSEY